MDNKILNGVFKILKVISWIWILLLAIFHITVKTTSGKSVFLNPIYIIITAIMMSPAIAILIWRHKADKKEKMENQIYKCFFGIFKKSKTINNVSNITINTENKYTKIYNDENCNCSNKISSKYIFMKMAKRKKSIIVVCSILTFFLAINYIARVNGKITSVEITNMVPSDNNYGWTKIFFKLNDTGKKDFAYSKDIEIYKKADWESLSNKDKQGTGSGKKKYISGDIVYNNDGYSVDTPLENEGDYVLAIKGYKYDTRKLGIIPGMIFLMLNNDDDYYYVTYNFNLSKEFFAKTKQNNSAQGSEKNNSFTLTINHLDSIVNLIDKIYNEFNNSENWYNGHPVINNNILMALNNLEDTDTKPLQDIIAIRKQYDLAEKLAKVSININETKSDLISIVRKAYFPTENSDWEGDIKKAKELFNKSEGYVTTYRSIKSEIEKGNIH